MRIDHRYMLLKDFLRSALHFLHLDLTKNLEYDRLTKVIMRKCISHSDHCIDVGCHKGEILMDICALAPAGPHWAFEPIPELYEKLCTQFVDRPVHILPYALAEKTGETTFNWVKNAPAYSGIRQRKYDIATPDIEEITVQLRSLDEVIPEDFQIDFIKIDVEGAEMGVLRGARRLLQRCRPVVVFEFGLGASDFYRTRPADIYHYLTGEIGLHINTLRAFTRQAPPLSKEDFETLYQTNREYYFIAYPEGMKA